VRLGHGAPRAWWRKGENKKPRRREPTGWRVYARRQPKLIAFGFDISDRTGPTAFALGGTIAVPVILAGRFDTVGSKPDSCGCDYAQTIGITAFRTFIIVLVHRGFKTKVLRRLPYLNWIGPVICSRLTGLPSHRLK